MVDEATRAPVHKVTADLALPGRDTLRNLTRSRWTAHEGLINTLSSVVSPRERDCLQTRKAESHPATGAVRAWSASRSARDESDEVFTW